MVITCIDFETANSFRGSVCSVAIARFENGELITSKSWLVKPHEDYYFFDGFNTLIHGIQEEDVENELEFDQVYKQILPYFHESVVVAHNAAFDMSVLRNVLNLYGIKYPEIDYLCTYKIALKTWNGLDNYKLNTICKHFDYNFSHHNAEADAIACGNVFNWATKEHQASNHLELIGIIGLSMGKMMDGDYKPCGTYKKNQLNISSITPKTDNFNENHELYNKKVVFTGTLSSMQRKDAMQEVVNLGGNIGDNVTKDSDFLVMGIQDYSVFVDGKESNKTKKAQELIRKGKSLQIIDEETFVKLLCMEE